MEQQTTTNWLPELTWENLDAVMAERLQATRNGHTVVPMLWQGLWKLPVHVGEQTRSATVYLPKDIPQGSPFVFLNVPQGWQTEAFLRKSGWIGLADERQFCLFAAEPEQGGWKTPEEERPYLKACYHAETYGAYCMPHLSSYLVGYGQIGLEVHKLVIEDPLFVAAAAFLDASDLEEDVLAAYQQKEYHFAPETITMPLREIPVPVWICSQRVDARTRALADYWIAAAHARETGRNAVYGIQYRQQEALYFTPEGNILEVDLQQARKDYADPYTTRAICGFLFRYHRYGRGSRSNQISRKVDQQKLGVQVHYFVDPNGIPREYLVYMPESCQGKGRVPLVLALHGASQSMRNMFDNSMWYQKARQEGFIVVMAESGLGKVPRDLQGEQPLSYRPVWHDVSNAEEGADLSYLEALVDRLMQQYPVDSRRMYLTGHSMGCMTSLYVGTSAVANRFAAIAATSGIAAREAAGTQERRPGVPVFLTMGEYDLWSYDLACETGLTRALDFYLKDNGLADEEHVKDLRRNGAKEQVCGKFHDYLWADAAGVPRVRYSWIQGWGHVNLLEPNIHFWDEWFSKWSLDEAGDRHYNP